MIKFDGFSVPDRQRLIASVMVLKSTSKKAKTAMLSRDLTYYYKWFDGTGKNAHLMKVASIIKEIDEAINYRPITFANATGNAIDRGEAGLCGYVWLIRNRGAGDKFSESVHVGSGMRVLLVPRTHGGKINDLAETMYHELSHKVGGTKDITYDHKKCLDNALKKPQLAALNAENYNKFFSEYSR
jgi:hypothetical protein